MEMTRETAERIVKGITDKIEANTADMNNWAEFWGFTVDEYEEFLDMAIEALEQQPCEDKIVEWKKDFKEYVNSLSMLNDDYKGIMEYIDELPVTPQQPCEDAISRADVKKYLSAPDANGERVIYESDLDLLSPVQPKPKTGHWIFDEILDRNYYCSECKSMGVDYWDYCPYCGCRMVEP